MWPPASPCRGRRDAPSASGLQPSHHEPRTRGRQVLATSTVMIPTPESLWVPPLSKENNVLLPGWLIPIGFRSLDAEGRDQNPVSPPAARQNVHLALAVRSSVQEREQGGGANRPGRHAPRAREQAGPRLRTAQRAGRPVPREQALRPQQVRLPGGEGAGHPHCRLKAREGPRPERLALGRPRPPQFQRRLLSYLEMTKRTHVAGGGVETVPRSVPRTLSGSVCLRPRERPGSQREVPAGGRHHQTRGRRRRRPDQGPPALCPAFLTLPPSPELGGPCFPFPG